MKIIKIKFISIRTYLHHQSYTDYKINNFESLGSDLDLHLILSVCSSFVLTVNLDLDFSNFFLQITTTVQDMCNLILKLKLDLDLHIGFVSNNILIQIIFSAEVV